nr:hypothetical protein [Haladaptatus sp. W1]
MFFPVWKVALPVPAVVVAVRFVVGISSRPCLGDERRERGRHAVLEVEDDRVEDIEVVVVRLDEDGRDVRRINRVTNFPLSVPPVDQGLDGADLRTSVDCSDVLGSVHEVQPHSVSRQNARVPFTVSGLRSDGSHSEPRTRRVPFCSETPIVPGGSTFEIVGMTVGLPGMGHPAVDDE